MIIDLYHGTYPKVYARTRKAVETDKTVLMEIVYKASSGQHVVPVT